MATARIAGNVQLHGHVTVSGSKNASLPILAAALLTNETCTINNVPKLVDIDIMLDVLRALGVSVSWTDVNTVQVRAERILGVPPAHLIRRMRGSVCLMGALVGRLGEAQVAIPGGCAIGTRPIDLHIKGFRALGYSVDVLPDLLVLKDNGIHEAVVELRSEHGSTMTGTINVVFAALRVAEETIIECAAMEPEVVDVCRCLVSMGADITGIGTSRIRIMGGRKLHGCDYTVIGDRLEAGTFVCAALATRGTVVIHGLEVGLLDPLISTLHDMHANVSQDINGNIYVAETDKLNNIDVVTAPHPGFPTDLQSQLCVLLTQAHGRSSITENIYPERFLYTTELNKMGAEILVTNACASINGPTKLYSSSVTATDLRASAALYLAGLCASGETTIHDIQHLDRGYEAFEEKLTSLGANIKREQI